MKRYRHADRVAGVNKRLRTQSEREAGTTGKPRSDNREGRNGTRGESGLSQRSTAAVAAASSG